MGFILDLFFVLLVVGMAIHFGNMRHRDNNIEKVNRKTEDNIEEIRKLKEEVRQLRQEQENLKR